MQYEKILVPFRKAQAMRLRALKRQTGVPVAELIRRAVDQLLKQQRE